MALILAILLDGNSEHVYSGGQLVSGHVLVQNSENIRMRGIRLEVCGSAYVSWDEGTGDDKTSYSGHEEYIKLEINLIGSRSHDCEMDLESSVHRFPFSFILPVDIPQSFEGVHGCVRYRLKAVIDRPFRVDDEAEVSLTVLRSLDLELEPPNLREPMVIQSQATAIGCCCVGGLTDVTLTINRGCFLPGDTINVCGEVVNRSNANIKYLTISLVQNVEFCDTGFRGIGYAKTYHQNTLMSYQRPCLPKGFADRWENITFVVPPVPPSRLDGCKIINIRYYVEVLAIFYEFCWTLSSAHGEIVIGDIGLRNENSQSLVVTSQPHTNLFPKHIQLGLSPAPVMPSISSTANGYRTRNDYTEMEKMPEVDCDVSGFHSANLECSDHAEVHIRSFKMNNPLEYSIFNSSSEAGVSVMDSNGSDAKGCNFDNDGFNKFVPSTDVNTSETNFCNANNKDIADFNVHIATSDSNATTGTCFTSSETAYATSCFSSSETANSNNCFTSSEAANVSSCFSSSETANATSCFNSSETANTSSCFTSSETATLDG